MNTWVHDTTPGVYANREGDLIGAELAAG